MSQTFELPRVEGGVILSQDDQGRIRLQGPPPRFFETRLAGRSPQDAVFLTQQVGADSSVSHALAAVWAWEGAGGLSVAENGRLLRELLHALSLLHSHVRHFYQQSLPDYLPPASLSAYQGDFPLLQRLREGIDAQSSKDWTRFTFDHPFSQAEVEELWEHTVLAMRTLALLQRMMAVIGGKFPVVMSVVPGGVNTSLSEAMVLKLRGYLNEVRDFLDEAIPEDGLLLLKRHAHLRTLGRGGEGFLCAGSGEDDAAFETSLFPSGVFFDGQLDRFAALAVESFAASYYRLPASQPPRGAVVVPAPDKAEAYSWIKAPRYNGRAAETGAFARMLIAYVSGAHMHNPTRVDDIVRLLGSPLAKANTVGGRILARTSEAGALVERCDLLLDQLDPAHPTVQGDNAAFQASGEGFGYIEAPAGAVQHHLVLRKGRVVTYDIIAPSTWNGSPEDENKEPGSLETALNREGFRLASAANRRDLSRIVQSFDFSMSDAVQ